MIVIDSVTTRHHSHRNGEGKGLVIYQNFTTVWQGVLHICGKELVQTEADF